MGFLQGLVKFVLVTLVVIVVGVGLLVFVAGFNDGPLAIIPGGEFTSGERVTVEPDWSFAKDIGEVEFQLLDPPSSRTSWIAVVDNRVFIPCGYMDTAWGRLWKQWPIDAQEDGRAILRIDGKLYDRTLVRVKDDPALTGVLSELGRKYMNGAEIPLDVIANDSLWVFELLPRS